MDRKRLTLGDGHVSTSQPAAGAVYACNGPGPIGGSQLNGPWIGATTWDETAKIHVQGMVSWPSATYNETVAGGTRTISTNDLPVRYKTGSFPIAATDPAHRYDANPNSIAAHATTIKLPATPTVASSPGCLPDGPIGILVNGVLLFDAVDGPHRDAAAHEIQDSCGGHPAPGNVYHYHDASVCLLAAASGPSTLIGWADDGFPIVVERNDAGELPTNADLDQCHGRTSGVILNGQILTQYHYDATFEYPYTLGCFHGKRGSG